MGACPAGGGHDGLQSGDYTLVNELNIANTPTPGQHGWRFCSNCFGLFFSYPSLGTPTPGKCPAGGGHAALVTYEEATEVFFGDYPLTYTGPSSPGEHGWRFCSKCLGLFLISRRSPEACPAGDIHDATQSGDYSLANNVSSYPGQHGWRFCSKCMALFFSGRGILGICPAGGGHEASHSGDYGLTLAGYTPPPSSTPTPTKTATYAFYLAQQPVWEGVIPYSAVFGVGINGHLVSLTNPAANTFAPGKVGLVTPTGATIDLAPGVSTSAADMVTLYGTSSAPLPVVITAIVYTGVYSSIRIDVTYTYQ
jgi:hypothetical protein